MKSSELSRRNVFGKCPVMVHDFGGGGMGEGEEGGGLSVSYTYPASQ